MSLCICDERCCGRYINLVIIIHIPLKWRKRNKNACLNFLELKIGGSLYEVYLHKPTITTTMADVTTHTHELKDLHL